MSTSADHELPIVFPYHVFFCSQQRPPGHPRGSCGARGAGPLWQKLGALVEGRQLPGVSLVPTGCLGFCQAGPLMVVYPQGVWYQPRTPEDLERIVASHFQGGQIVEDLAVVPSPSGRG